MNSKKIAIAIQTISKHLTVENKGKTVLNKADLIHYLNGLINSDYNKLIALLYRVDVDEQKIRKALSTASSENLSGAVLADLIIERELEKMYWRERMKNEKNNNNNE